MASSFADSSRHRDLPRQYRILRKSEYSRIKTQAEFDNESVDQLGKVLGREKSVEGAWKTLGLKPTTAEVTMAVMESRGIPCTDLNALVQAMHVEGGKHAAEREAARQIRVAKQDQAETNFTMEGEDQSWLVQDDIVNELGIARATFSIKDLEDEVEEHVKMVLALSDKVWEVSRNKLATRSDNESKGARRLVGTKHVLQPHSGTWLDFQDRYVSSKDALFKARPWVSRYEALLDARVKIEKESTMKRKELDRLQNPSDDDEEEEHVRDLRAERALAWRIDELDRQAKGLDFATEVNEAAELQRQRNAPPLSAYAASGPSLKSLDPRKEREGGRLPWAQLRVSDYPSGKDATRGVMSHTGALCPEKDSPWNHFDENNCPVPEPRAKDEVSNSLFTKASPSASQKHRPSTSPKNARRGSKSTGATSPASSLRGPESPVGGRGHVSSSPMTMRRVLGVSPMGEMRVDGWRHADGDGSFSVVHGATDEETGEGAKDGLGAKWLAKSLQEASKGWAGFDEIVPKMQKNLFRRKAASVASVLAIRARSRREFTLPSGSRAGLTSPDQDMSRGGSRSRLNSAEAGMSRSGSRSRLNSVEPQPPISVSSSFAASSKESKEEDHEGPKDRELLLGRWSEAVNWASRGEVVGADTVVGTLLLKVGGKALKAVPNGEKIGLYSARYSPIFLCLSGDELAAALELVVEGREADLVLLGDGLGRSEVAKKMARRRMKRRIDEREQLQGKWGLGAGSEMLRARDALYGEAVQGGRKGGLMRQDLEFDDAVRAALLGGDGMSIEDRAALARMQEVIASMRVRLLRIGNVVQGDMVDEWDEPHEVTVCVLDRSVRDGDWNVGTDGPGAQVDIPLKGRSSGRWASTLCAILSRAGLPCEVEPEPFKVDALAAEDLAYRCATWLVSDSKGGIMETELVANHRDELERLLAEFVHIARAYLEMPALSDGGKGGGKVDWSLGAAKGMGFKIVSGSEGQEMLFLPGGSDLNMTDIGPKSLGAFGKYLSGAGGIIERHHNPTRLRSSKVPKRPSDLSQTNGWFLTYAGEEQQPYHVELLRACKVDVDWLLVHGRRRKMEAGVLSSGAWEPRKEATMAEKDRDKRLGVHLNAPKTRPRTVSSMMREPLWWLG